MDMTGETRIAAPRDRVWEALNDPEVLKASIAGCEELEKVSDTEFTAKVRAKVGPVSARFAGRVTLHDLDAPNGYRIEGEGTGGAAGFANGGAVVRLEPDGDATLLRYEATAQVGGKLAQIGSRLIQGTARKMADDFFNKFGQIVAGEPASAPSGDRDHSAPVEPMSEQATPAGDKPLPPPVQPIPGSQAAPPDSPSQEAMEPSPAPAAAPPGPAAARAETPPPDKVERQMVAGPTAFEEAKLPPAQAAPPARDTSPAEGWSGVGRKQGGRSFLPWVIAGVVVVLVLIYLVT